MNAIRSDDHSFDFTHSKTWKMYLIDAKRCFGNSENIFLFGAHATHIGPKAHQSSLRTKYIFAYDRMMNEQGILVTVVLQAHKRACIASLFRRHQWLRRRSRRFPREL